MGIVIYSSVVLSTPVGRIRKGKRAGVVALRVWVLDVELILGIEDGEADGVTEASGVKSREKAIEWADAACEVQVLGRQRLSDDCLRWVVNGTWSGSGTCDLRRRDRRVESRAKVS